MRSDRRRLLGFALSSSSAVLPGLWMLPSFAADPPAGWRTLTWEELVPEGWDPFQHMRSRQMGGIREGDPREVALMKELRALWDDAPTRSELDGAKVRLPGYVVPIEQSSAGVKEFLLVPYFGACIHNPPPPANQIVHVVLPEPKALRTMDVVWVGGTLTTSRQDSAWGKSGYRIDGQKLEPYKANQR